MNKFEHTHINIEKHTHTDSQTYCNGVKLLRVIYTLVYSADQRA